jgi:hypothetical protein
LIALICVTLIAQAESPELHEIDALCVLDFYVHESCQRQGIGKLLFEVSAESAGLLLQMDDDFVWIDDDFRFGTLVGLFITDVEAP